MFFILPSIVAITFPFLIEEPSFFFGTNFIFLSISLKVCLANSNPPIIPFSLLINLIFLIELLSNKFDVMSPDG